MRIDTRPRRKNSPRPAEKAALGFLQWLRGRDCIWAGNGECGGKMEPQHLDFAGDKGTSTKVSDRYCLPSCALHHRLQHDKGWDTFLAMMGESKEKALNTASGYWRAWPGRIAWERKLEQ